MITFREDANDTDSIRWMVTTRDGFFIEIIYYLDERSLMIDADRTSLYSDELEGVITVLQAVKSRIQEIEAKND